MALVTWGGLDRLDGYDRWVRLDGLVRYDG